MPIEPKLSPNMIQNQDPDDLPFEAGEELTVVSKVQYTTQYLMTLIVFCYLVGRGAMVDSRKLPWPTGPCSSALSQACPTKEATPPPPPQERAPLSQSEAF